MKYLYYFLLVSILFIASCMESNRMGRKDVLLREGNEVVLKLESCKLKIPENITIEYDIPKNPPLPDFNIYSFKYEGKTILVAYFGNHPSMDNNRKEMIKKGQINGMKYEHFKSEDDDKINYYHFLITIPKLKEWWNRPMYAHFWYSNLSPEEEVIATSIIESFTMLE